MNENFVQDDQGRRFRVTKRKLGRGTFADVYKGEWHQSSDTAENTGADQQVTTVAIKQFHLSRQTLDRALSTEIELMRELDHPNIVKMISVITLRRKEEEDADQLWVVLEFCGGGDFSKFLKDPKDPKGRLQRRLSEKWACKYMTQIAEGLRYLRSRDIVHRDLKPHNLLLTEDRRVIKIADFGFARVMGSNALEATMCGSPLYMAPEVLNGDEYNNKADLWSVGIILFEMLCGERPFKEVSTLPVLRARVAHEPIQFPKRVVISADCRELLSELLQKDPNKRIEWDDFFNHVWFETDWSAPPPTDTMTRPGMPPPSAPVAIPRGGGLQLNIVSNYVGRISSAPMAMMHPPLQSPPVQSPPLRSSTSITRSADPSASTFVGATTPHGGSDFTLRDDSVEMRQSTSFRQSVSDIFSTGVGLLKDSFKSTRY